MILPWLLVFLVLGVAILGLSITLKRKAEAHRNHHPVPERDIAAPRGPGDVHGRMADQHGSYVGPS